MKDHAQPYPLRRAIKLIRSARGAIGATGASLFLVDAAAGSVHGLISEWDWTRTSFPSRLEDWPSVAGALSDGKVRRISAADAGGAESGWFERLGIQSTLCVPLLDGSQALGVLFFDFDATASPFGSGEAALLSDVARRCVRALCGSSGMYNLGAIWLD